MYTSARIATKPSSAAAMLAISTTIERRLRGTPGAERLQHRSETPAALGEDVLGVRRRGVHEPPLEHAGRLELAQPLGQRARRHALDCLAELVEARRALER